MKGLSASAIAVTVLALSVAGPTATATAQDNAAGSITVAFGAGLNTAQPGNTPNHHIIPQEFRVRITKAKNLNGDELVVPATVNFTVSGFHWVWVYKDGVTLEEVQANVPAAGLFVNYDVNVFAKGIDPASATTLPLDSAQNRTESFGFSEPGRYLVICNVRPHFLDGMYAWIQVIGPEGK